MYSTKPALVYGFHGLDRQIAMEIVSGKKEFKQSTNDYDWLGSGIYFWENNYERAKQYAVEDSKRTNSSIMNPFVLGAIIDLGNCLDLLDQSNIDILSETYQEFENLHKTSKWDMPINETFGDSDFDFMNRKLDCAVMKYLIARAEASDQPIDSVRSAFIEAEPAYPGSMIRQKNHIQLAIRNPNCIKGIFIPRTEDEDYPSV